MQRGLLLLVPAVLAAGVLALLAALLAAVRAQRRAAARAVAAREREKALILTVDNLTEASSQQTVLRAVR